MNVYIMAFFNRNTNSIIKVILYPLYIFVTTILAW